jgi:hypothetical protein
MESRLGCLGFGVVGMHYECAVTDLVLHVARSSCLWQLPFALYVAGYIYMHLVRRRLCACV